MSYLTLDEIADALNHFRHRDSDRWAIVPTAAGATFYGHEGDPVLDLFEATAIARAYLAGATVEAQGPTADV